LNVDINKPLIVHVSDLYCWRKDHKFGGFKINVPALWSLHIMMVLVHIDTNKSSTVWNFTERSRVILSSEVELYNCFLLPKCSCSIHSAFLRWHVFATIKERSILCNVLKTFLSCNLSWVRTVYLCSFLPICSENL
jgi:hypothetical protein